jgi:hypothetical protein
MAQQEQQAKCRRLETRIDSPNRSSHPSTLAAATQNHTPMGRWESEKAEDQPWNAFAASKTDSGWRECFGLQVTSSTKGEQVSVGEETK